MLLHYSDRKQHLLLELSRCSHCWPSTATQASARRCMDWLRRWKVPGVSITGVQPFWTRFSSYLQYSLLKSAPIFFRLPQRKNQEDSGLVNNLSRILVPAFLSIAQWRKCEGNFWRCNWNGLGPHLARTTGFVGYPMGRYLITGARRASNNVGKQRHWVYGAKHTGLRKSRNNTSWNVNWELLLMSGLNCTMWIYVTPNVSVMES